MPPSGPSSIAPLAAEAVSLLLAGTIFAGKLDLREVTESTSTLAQQAAAAGAPEGTVFVAEEQTRGRGRGGHAWYSEPRTGIYCSVVLRPRIEPSRLLWLSLMAGMAARQAVIDTSALIPDLRWPNDLLLGGKKFGGILSELATEGAAVRHAVIGIGINVNQGAFPEDLRGIATSLRLEAGRVLPREALLGALLQSLDREYRRMCSSGPEDGAALLARFEAASSYARGMRVQVEEQGGYSGVTEGLDERGLLRVRTADGLRTVISGGVRPEA